MERLLDKIRRLCSIYILCSALSTIRKLCSIYILCSAFLEEGIGSTCENFCSSIILDLDELASNDLHPVENWQNIIRFFLL